MRNPPHIWKRFFSLKTGDAFSIGKKAYFKSSFFKAQPLPITLCPPGTVSLFRRVRTTQPVKKLRPPSGILRSTEAFEQVQSFTGCAMSDEGRTHYVGDSCPGGHRELGPTGAPMGTYINGEYVTTIAERALRDPMVQDHTPSPQPKHERTL